MKINNLINSPVKFKVKELIPQVYHLEFKTQKDLTSTLLRFQEHYESPKFRKKIFSFKEFISWYKLTRNGKFTYFLDWSGFNFPSSVLKPFKDGRFGKLSKREQLVLDQFNNNSNKFYIIATYKSKNYKNDLEVKKHELAHSLFYLNKKYQKKVLNILSKVNIKPIHKYLKKIGYHQSVWTDESHAYLLTDTDSLRLEKIDLKPYLKAIIQLEKNYQKYIQNQ